MGDRRINPQKFHLSPNEREAIYSKKSDDKMRGETLDKIQDELSLQAERLQYLLNDTAYLYSAGILSSEYWPDGWENIQDIEYPEDIEVNHNWRRRDVGLEGFPNDSGEFHFGFLLGQLARMYHNGLTGAEDAEDFANKKAKLLSGFQTGLIGQSIEADYQELEDKLFTHTRKYLDHRNMGRATDRIATQYDLQPHNTDPASVADRLDIELSSALEDRLYTSTLGEAKTVSGHPDYVYSVLKGLLMEKQFGTIERLIYKIEADIERLNDTKAGHTQAIDIFDFIWRYRESNWITAGTISTQLNERKQNISEICNIMSGRGERSDRWEKRPLLKRRPGDTGSKYRLTTYGTLFAVCTERNEISEYLHKYGLEREVSGEELVKRTIDDIL